jgi:hypothetical protein
MVQIPTTERKFYDTTPKANTLALYADALKPAVQNANKIFMDQQRIKIATKSTQARIEADDYVKQMRLQFQGNPDSPEFKQTIQSGLSDIFNRYGEDIDPMAKGEWNLTANKMTGAYELSNNDWIINQREDNAKLDIAEKMAIDFDLAYKHGANGNVVAGRDDLQDSYNNLLDYAQKNMGETEARKLLKDYERKYTLNYLNGLMKSNPAAAKQMLEDEKTQQVIGSKSAVDTLKKMSADSEVKQMKKYIQEQNTRQQHAYLKFLKMENPTIADLEAYKDNFEPDMPDAKYDRLLKMINERNPEADTNVDVDIETSKELKSIMSFPSVSIADLNKYLDKAIEFVEKVKKKNKEGKLSLEQSDNYSNLAINAAQNKDVREAINNIPDFDAFKKIVPVPAREPEYKEPKEETTEQADFFEESIGQYANYEKYDRVLEDLRKEAKDADTEEKQQDLLKKITNFASHVQYDEDNNNFLKDDAKKLIDKAENLAKQAVFKRNLYNMPQPGFWRESARFAFNWFSSIEDRNMRKDIDYIAKDTMASYIGALSSGDVEGANKIYEEGMHKAIMRRYKRFIPEGTKLEAGKTILNLEGTPCIFMGFGATDICVRVDD